MSRNPMFRPGLSALLALFFLPGPSFGQGTTTTVQGTTAYVTSAAAQTGIDAIIAAIVAAHPGAAQTGNSVQWEESGSGTYRRVSRTYSIRAASGFVASASWAWGSYSPSATVVTRSAGATAAEAGAGFAAATIAQLPASMNGFSGGTLYNGVPGQYPISAFTPAAGVFHVYWYQSPGTQYSCWLTGGFGVAASAVSYVDYVEVVSYCNTDGGIPPSCDDSNVCTVDSCSLDAGCLHATVSCDDGQACTVDSCRPDAGCAHAIDAGACACTAGAIPPTSFKVERTVDLGELPCIGVDGKLSASLKFTAEGSATVATCGNACASEASLSTSASVAVSLCTDKVTITGSGSSSEKRSYVPECNPATCGLGCGAGYCGTDDHSGSLGVEVGRTFSKGWDKTAFGISAGLRCNGTLSGNGSVGGGRKEVSNQGDTRGTCLNCVENSVNLSGGLGISKTGCALSLGFRGSSSSVACKECLAVSGQLTGTYTSKAGACGSSSCAGLLSTVKLAAETPKLKAKTLWWDVQAQCKAAVTACGESRTCGACSCGGGTCSDLSTKFSCSVMRSGSPLIQTVSP